MPVFDVVLHNIIVLFICIIFGFIGEKTKILTPQVCGNLSQLMLKVTLPCSILVSMQRAFSKAFFLDSILMAFISTFVFLLGMLLAYIFCRLLKVSKEKWSVFLVALMLPNVMYMGAPVISAVFGSDALFYIAIANIPFNILAFTLCIRLLAKNQAQPHVHGDWKSVALNPAVNCAVVGMLFFLTSIKLPAAVNDGLSLMGSMTTPTAMLIIGAVLARNDMRLFLKDIMIYPFVLLKLVVLPFIIFMVCKLFLQPGLLFGVIYLVAAMPCGTMTVILVSQYGGDEGLASRMVCVSTLFSIITIPMMSLLL